MRAAIAKASVWWETTQTTKHVSWTTNVFRGHVNSNSAALNLDMAMAHVSVAVLATRGTIVEPVQATMGFIVRRCVGDMGLV